VSSVGCEIGLKLRPARWRRNAYDINVIHASGAAALAPLCSRFPELPRLKLFGQPGEFQAANHAAFRRCGLFYRSMVAGRRSQCRRRNASR
jgi:hypothetical protein